MRIWDARLVRCSFSTSREELAIFGALNCSHPELFTCIQISDVRHVPTASRPASLLHFGWCRFVGVRRVTAARNSRTSGMLLGQVHVGKLWVWVEEWRAAKAARARSQRHLTRPILRICHRGGPLGWTKRTGAPTTLTSSTIARSGNCRLVRRRQHKPALPPVPSQWLSQTAGPHAWTRRTAARTTLTSSTTARSGSRRQRRRCQCKRQCKPALLIRNWPSQMAGPHAWTRHTAGRTTLTSLTTARSGSRRRVRRWRRRRRQRRRQRRPARTPRGGSKRTSTWPSRSRCRLLLRRSAPGEPHR